METFGRGCLYCIIGVAVLLFIAFILQAHISIPWFVTIPLIALAFWIASEKTKSKNDE